MSKSDFDFGTAAFVLCLMLIVVVVVDYRRGESHWQHILRVEKALRSYCAGAPKLEACSALDLPLQLHEP